MKLKKLSVVKEDIGEMPKKVIEPYKVYLSSEFSNKILVQAMAELFTELFSKEELKIVSVWHSIPFDNLMEEDSDKPFKDIESCDCLIAASLVGNDSCTEVGYALGLDKDVVYLRSDELSDDDPSFVAMMTEVDIYGTKNMYQYDNPNLRFAVILNDMENVIRFLRFRIKSLTVPTEKDAVVSN